MLNRPDALSMRLSASRGRSIAKAEGMGGEEAEGGSGSAGAKLLVARDDDSDRWSRTMPGAARTAWPDATARTAKKGRYAVGRMHVCFRAKRPAGVITAARA